ncbi:hypothetical protein LSTR_LSTR007138 [Laodelphax striatellus]|uniref:SOCS box domain-containing protein n=1 Tax=Laodelphax striatellus TaxID=195883 RepID=A0A482WWQ1_LAOST|nr:hypothetical protein LSTR_LSTR007138 [Laodelphax striatellus]
MGSAVSTGHDNDDLIDNLVQGSYIKTAPVEEVFRAVDRAFYYLPEHRDNAYHDLAWKNGNLHLSAPCVYCEVMESLELKPGLSFLNIGSGTGYFNTMAGLILGANGTNHGIEMFEDNVQYANMKLEEFKRTAPAIDSFEFCEPKFVTGNGFCLPFGCQLYDRVYCGAAVPETHASHVQSFLKIGGILVMPYNNHLVQMRRLSFTQYDFSIVLPVSFATLRMPDATEAQQTVSLPELASVLSLKEVCRIAVRRLIRAGVEPAQPPPQMPAATGPLRRKRQQQMIVAKLCQMSDDETVDCYQFFRPTNRRNGLDDEDEEEDEEEDEGVEEEEEEEEGEEEGAESASMIIAQRRKVAKREKFDSGLGEEMENGKGLTSEEEEEEEEDDDSDDSEIGEQNAREAVRRKAIMVRQLKARREAERVKRRNCRADYGPQMRNSIMQLPLPKELKAYLNFYRDF